MNRAWSKMRSMRREIAELRRALDWYAVLENWRRRSVHPKGSTRKRWELSPAHKDRGARARAVLNAHPSRNPVRRLIELFKRRPLESAPEQLPMALAPIAVTVPQPLASDQRQPLLALDAEADTPNAPEARQIGEIS